MIALTLDCRHVMTDEYHRSSVCDRKILHLARTFFLKFCVPHGKHLVTDQDIRFEVRTRYCKGESHIHAAAVALYGRVKELLDFCEVDDLVEFFPESPPAPSRGLRH